MLKSLIRWTNNDMVMAFDECGQQVAEFQGPYEEVRAKVLAAAGERTTFEHATWGGRHFEQVPREAW